MSIKLNEWERQVREFHSKFNADIGDQNLPRFKNAQLRKNLLTEEVDEFIHAVNNGNFDNAVHEAIDILYVTIGALVAWGITDISDYFSAIHAVNMNKVGGKSREDGKVLKPKDWKPADIGILIRTQPTRLAKKERLSTEQVENITIEQVVPHLDVPIVPDNVIRPEETLLNVEVSTEETKKTGGRRGRVARAN